MTRFLMLIALSLAATALFLPAEANPLAQIKEAARESRDAAEEHSEKVAKEAGHDHDHDHADHHGHAAGAHGQDQGDHHADHVMLVPRAIAVMLPTEGNQVHGRIMFEQTPGGVVVTAMVSGLNPNQKHGFHIHEFGDISDPAGQATGGHYDPGGHDHVLPNGDHAGHAGDLGNLHADAEGNATYTKTFGNVTIAGTKNPVLGRGVIIHAKPDDGGQPTGNAGARIAQGVIGVAR